MSTHSSPVEPAGESDILINVPFMLISNHNYKLSQNNRA